MLGKIKYQWKKIVTKRTGYIGLIGVISLFLVVGGFSYAMFAMRMESKGSLNIVTGDLFMSIKSEQLDSKNRITVGAGESKEIVVTLKNENERDSKFNFWYEAGNEVEVTYDSESDIPPKEEGEVIKIGEERTYKLVITNNSDRNQIVSFGSNSGFYDKELSFPEGKRIVEKKNENITIIKDNNMIAVVYNETASTWEKASNDNWYNYKIGKWANAVTVTSATRSKYQSAESGTIIPMSDIETMWVYIPRYSYTIGSEDGTAYYGKKGEYLSSMPTQALPGEIDIKFIGKEEKETGSAQYKVSEGISGWRTPDGFTFGNEELSGIWVGKFETSSSNPTAANGGGDVTTLDAMIKPNVVSWRDIRASTMAEVGRKLTANGNRYGFANDKLNSHAMKTVEWAVAAYLSQSKYGKLGNKDYSGANKEIYKNKSDKCVTGCSYGAPNNKDTDYGCQYTYDVNISGTGASTTGTVYGIYDMNGGAYDNMMSTYAPSGKRYVGTNTSYHSGYTGLLTNGTTFTGRNWLEDKYYNFYETNDPSNACNGNMCITHALNETQGWYNSIFSLGWTDLPWNNRGGYYKDYNSGIFGVNRTIGCGMAYASFRLVLSAS